MIEVSDIFDVQYGNSFELNRLTEVDYNQGVPFISRTTTNNGISAYVKLIDNIPPFPAGELTCALSGNGVMSTFLQDSSYYTGYHIARLIPKICMTKIQMLFYCYALNANRFRYSYGRQANKTLNKLHIPSPDMIPKWISEFNLSIFNESYKPKSINKKIILNTNKWKEFQLDELFDIKKGKRLIKSDMTHGDLPYLGASALNNGITQRIDAKALFPGNVISVNYDGSIGEAFYQPEPFWASDAVNVLTPKFNMSPTIALFICTLIRTEKYRYNYGRKWVIEKMKSSKIKLPVTITGDPDWSLMESYVNQLPYSSLI